MSPDEVVPLSPSPAVTVINYHVVSPGLSGSAGPDPALVPVPWPQSSDVARSPPSEAESTYVDERFYCAWQVPGAPEAVGVWHGPHPRCWRQLERCLAGGQYTGSGARLRRYPDEESARAAWLTEGPRASRSLLPREPPIHRVK